MKRLFPALLLSSLVAACAAFEDPMPAPTPDAVALEEAPTTSLPRSVHWLRNSAEHEAIFVQTYRLAEWVLEAQVADLAVGTWAVALDADETVIDNSLYEREIALLGESMTDESWDAWVERREATPLPGVLTFLDRVRALGGRIAIVTNRREHHCAATRDVLSRHRVPFDVVLCRGDEREKTGRWAMVTLGDAKPGLPPLRIVMWLGDNIHDFPDLDQSARFGNDAVFADFGTRFFILPNPSYGSWQTNPEN